MCLQRQKPISHRGDLDKASSLQIGSFQVDLASVAGLQPIFVEHVIAVCLSLLRNLAVISAIKITRGRLFMESPGSDLSLTSLICG